MRKTRLRPAASQDPQVSQDPGPSRLSIRRKVAFGVFAALLFFVCVELLLRLAGFQIATSVEHMKFSFPLDDYNQSAPQRFLQPDDELFWKPIPGVLGHNLKGFYGPEFEIKKPVDTFRIVFLGDSCTHFGPISYPDILRDYLDKNAKGRFEVINAACIGYTSEQGRRLMENQVVKWSADLVVVYFGWNDHWLARGIADKDQKPRQESVANWAAEHLRLVQLMQLLLNQGSKKRSDLMRVSIEDYQKNLAAMSQQMASRGASVWYITAPHAFDLGIPDYLHTSGEVAEPNDLIPLHRQYNEVVRDVSRRQAAPLLDLAAEIDQLKKDDLFIDDHIHLSQKGKLYLTKRLVDYLEERDIVTSQDDDAIETP
ncbi:MAG: SGNH/GDSL hydrolase family protein [Pirellulaceae bacterium]